ncbi:MAG: hypothetical protein ACW987_19620 [Candidatus Thorarchaeota archaeon]|jgi:hypothetical protein
MTYEELYKKFSQGIVDIQWEMTRCRDPYRLKTLSARLQAHAKEYEELSNDIIEELENG